MKSLFLKIPVALRFAVWAVLGFLAFFCYAHIGSASNIDGIWWAGGIISTVLFALILIWAIQGEKESGDAPTA